MAIDDRHHQGDFGLSVCSRRLFVPPEGAMSGYVTVNRLSLVQIQSEERKQQAHLKKISDMKRRSRLDNTRPVPCEHLKQGSASQVNEKRRTIANENNTKLHRLLEIMTTKTGHSPSRSHSTHPIRRQTSLNASDGRPDYLERISKTKGTYDARKWAKGYEEHKEHLKIMKDSKVFTPYDMGGNRQRIAGVSIATSPRRISKSSSIDSQQHADKLSQV